MGRADSPLHDRVAFLVGVRRSGTNWLRRIVDAHPDAVVIPSETSILSHGVAPLAARVQHGIAGSAMTGTIFVEPERFHDSVRQLCDDLLTGYLETLDEQPQLLAERTPDHVRHLDLVADVYPDARVVHIVRDGRDVARSLVSQPWGPTTYRDAATEWVTGIDVARHAAPRLDRYLEVRYEQLLADPPAHVPALYRFLGLDDRPEVIERALVEADVPYNVDPAADVVAANKWEGGLDAAALADIDVVAGALLHDLGYPPSGPAGAGVGARSEPGVMGATVRRVAAAARGAWPRSGADPVAFRREMDVRLGVGLRRVHALLDDVTTHRFDDLAAHFSGEARIRVVGGGTAWDLRGATGLERLVAELSGDDALRGRQLRGDVHPGVPAFTVVQTWEAPDGATADRVAVITMYDDRIDELTWYRLPRLGAEAARP